MEENRNSSCQRGDAKGAPAKYVRVIQFEDQSASGKVIQKTNPRGDAG